MTSRHNERLQARRQALREQHKRELEEAKRRQAAQLATVTTFDQRIAKLEDARREVAEAVAEAVAVFGGRREVAAALGLTAAEVRDYLNTHNRDADRNADGDGDAEDNAAPDTNPGAPAAETPAPPETTAHPAPEPPAAQPPATTPAQAPHSV
ncbi:hypothetical protein ACQEU8_35855 [Streptomyces sp. CA-250714]|uniref:hypothetical protein n=1 Tax=Streptomyces sp. CA-250714 TaxID=3240060 RepID=UPI003D913DB4